MVKFVCNYYRLSINNSMEKIKQFVESEKGKDILTVAIVILVGLGSFGLGRLSKQATSPGIKIEYPNQESNVIESQKTNSYNSPNVSNVSNTPQKVPNSGNYFASNKGKKYYPIGCSAGKTIKQENRIYFATSAEAEKAGYTLSSSCK